MKNQYSERKYVLGGVLVFIGIIYAIRLFSIQVLDPTYRTSAENNSMRYVPQYPGRGLIFDRNGKLLVYNEAAYDLQIIPRQMKTFDTTLFCNIIDISKENLIKEINTAKSYSRYKASVIIQQISSLKYAKLQEVLYKFQGFFVHSRPVRKYPGRIAAHILGYINEVNEYDIKKDDYYVMGDYIGATGLEQTYEEYLRGEKGVKIYLVDVHNRIKGSYADGKNDIPAQAGKNLVSTLDAELQAYGERLMKNKRGSIVAIEPSTGEILTLVTSPGYDPNLLVGRKRTKNYKRLKRDSLNPLFNRAAMASYPPGSTFKLINALVGLQEGVITPETTFPCRYGYHVGSFSLGCHHNASFDLIRSIQYSCNAYYCAEFRRILDNEKYPTMRDGYIQWREHVISFGLGKKLNTDLRNELAGLIPTPEYFDKKYGGKHRWKSLMLVSMAIGQGEIGVTPLQMANFAASIANRGFYYIPHLVKKIEDEPHIAERFITKNFTTIDSSYFRPIIEGMEQVVLAGTATTARVKDIKVCGKTGTAENPHGEDHSIFLAFAPKDNPQIAISVYVENAGFGSTWAAPIASLMIEKYLKGETGKEYPSSYWEKRILDANLLAMKPKKKNH